MTRRRAYHDVVFNREMHRAINNLDAIGKKLVPRAAAASTNKMARMINTAVQTKAAARLNIPRPVLKYHNPKGPKGKKQPRFKLRLAKGHQPLATLRMGRSAIPYVRLIKHPEKQDTRLAKMRKQKGIKAGNHFIRGAFLAPGVTRHAKGVLKGRYQVMGRTGRSRFPLTVHKIETREAITRHAIRETRRVLNQHSGSLLAEQLVKQAKKGLLK